MTRRYYSTTELAELLGVKPITLQKWRFKKKGPLYYRVGMKIQYAAEDVEAWLERRKARHED